MAQISSLIIDYVKKLYYTGDTTLNMYKSSCAIQHDENEAQKFGDYIGKLVHELFENQLPNKKGKPQSGREWTIISAVIMESIIKQQATAKVLYDLCFYKKRKWTYTHLMFSPELNYFISLML